MNNQSNFKRLGKSILIFLGMMFLLASAGILAGQLFGEDMTGPVFMFVFALGFFVLVFWSKKNWWAIIPGGLFASGGVAASMDSLIPDGKITGAVYLFLLAATFFTIVILSKKNWWAVIPGGILSSIGLVVVLENFIPHVDYPSLPNTLHMGVYVWVLFLGLAVTFGALWLMRKSQPTHWARYPAVGLLTVSLLAFLLGSRFQEVWLASILLGIGVMILLSVFTRKKQAISE